MSKEEIALELALLLIDKGNFYSDSSGQTNAAIGAAAAELYNAILRDLDAKQD